MAYKKYLFVILCLAFFNYCSAHTPREVYEVLNEKERGYFVRYYLAKGFVDSIPSNTRAAIYPGINFPDGLDIPIPLLNIFETITKEPEGFPASFLKMFMSKYNVTSYEAFLVAQKKYCECGPNEICLPNGKCLNVGDVGGICCT